MPRRQSEQNEATVPFSGLLGVADEGVYSAVRG